MTLEGKISHGVGIDFLPDFKLFLALGPIGTFVDMTNYYRKEEINAMMQGKQDSLTAGEDIWITDNVIDNKHAFFTDSEIQQIWDTIS